MAAYCQQCGAAHDDNARFCPTCGRPVGAAAPEAPRSYSEKYADTAWGKATTEQVSGAVPIAKGGGQTAKQFALSMLVGVALLTLLIAWQAGLFAHLGSSTSGTPAPRAPGSITFGTTLDSGTLVVTGQSHTFRAGETIACAAALSQPAHATSLRFIIAKVAAGGAETALVSQDTPISNPDFQVIGNSIDLSPLLQGSGSYVMRYYRDTTLLAEGTFTLTP